MRDFGLFHVLPGSPFDIKEAYHRSLKMDWEDKDSIYGSSLTVQVAMFSICLLVRLQQVRGLSTMF